MGDYHVQMWFDIEAEPAVVRRAITSREGVAAWWSNQVEGDPGLVGGEVRVSFPDAPMPFEFTVTELGDRRIEWQTGGFPPPWQGTSLRWDLDENAETGGTRLLFSHRGFDPDSEAIAVVTPVWVQVMLRLEEHAESGKTVPFFVG